MYHNEKSFSIEMEVILKINGNPTGRREHTSYSSIVLSVAQDLHFRVLEIVLIGRTALHAEHRCRTIETLEDLLTLFRIELETPSKMELRDSPFCSIDRSRCPVGL